MKLKAALVLMLLVLTSLLSFSNRCGMTCDGRTMTTATATAIAKATVNAACAINEEKKAGKIELAEGSALLRMTIVL
ncbi:MAG TPA: hypothetical protein VFZ47_07985 [Chitinophagaceae bacterium]